MYHANGFIQNAVACGKIAIEIVCPELLSQRDAPFCVDLVDQLHHHPDANIAQPLVQGRIVLSKQGDSQGVDTPEERDSGT